jgi:hypothetical protein
MAAALSAIFAGAKRPSTEQAWLLQADRLAAQLVVFVAALIDAPVLIGALHAVGFVSERVASCLSGS